MGSRRPAAVQEYVGTVLSWRQRDFVSTRPCRVNARYVVDSADAERILESKDELFELVERPVLAGIPLLVLGNKNDLPEAISVEQLIDQMCVLLLDWLMIGI